MSDQAKEFRSHLRTIHFALITISFSLAVVTTTPGRHIYEMALEQAELIAENRRELPRILDLAYQLSTEAAPGGPSPPLGEKQLSLKINLPSGCRMLLAPGGKLTAKHPPFSSIGTFPHADPREERPHFSAPETLRDFIQTWDYVNSVRLYSYVTEILDKTLLLATAEDIAFRITKPGLIGVERFEHASPQMHPPLSVCPHTKYWSLENLLQVRRRHASMREPSPFWTDSVQLRSDEWSYFLVGRFDDGLIVAIPVKMHSVRIDGLQKEFMNAVNWPPFREGEFGQTFRELDRLTTKDRSKELDELVASLQERLDEEGQSITIFSVRIEREVIPRWGTGILIAVSLYFLVHLRAYRNAGLNEEREVFPWIGSYKDSLSGLLLVASTVLLPGAATVLLARDSYQHAQYWPETLVPLGLAGFALLLLCCIGKEVLALTNIPEKVGALGSRLRSSS